MIHTLRPLFTELWFIKMNIKTTKLFVSITDVYSMVCVNRYEYIPIPSCWSRKQHVFSNYLTLTLISNPCFIQWYYTQRQTFASPSATYLSVLMSVHPICEIFIHNKHNILYLSQDVAISTCTYPWMEQSVAISTFTYPWMGQSVAMVMSYLVLCSLWHKLCRALDND
jgi:hypothetical protein